MNRRELIRLGSLSLTLPALSFGAPASGSLLPMKEQYGALTKFSGRVVAFTANGNLCITQEKAEEIAQILVSRMDSYGVWRGHPMSVCYIKPDNQPISEPIVHPGYFGCKTADESGLEEAYRNADADCRLLITEFARQWHGA